MHFPIDIRSIAAVLHMNQQFLATCSIWRRRVPGVAIRDQERPGRCV